MRKLVLFVDDDAIILDLYKAMMTGQGIEFQLANCPVKALEMLTEHPFKLVVTDHLMPGLTGAEFIPRARSIRPDATYMMVTGTPPENLEPDATPTRMIEKPFHPLELRDIIHQLAA